MSKVLVIHGPNLHLLGEREVNIYGETTLKEINDLLEGLAQKVGVTLNIVQSNHEGDIVDIIGRAKKDNYAAIVINPAAYTHTSVAIRDAIAAVNVPTIEVHLSNIYAREDFRHSSLIAPVCKGQITGFGAHSYVWALQAAVKLIKE